MVWFEYIWMIGVDLYKIYLEAKKLMESTPRKKFPGTVIWDFLENSLIFSSQIPVEFSLN